MKKLLIASLMACLLFSAAPVTEAREPGGVAGFFVGCCFGVRTAGQWNEGKDLHFRDWGRLIPLVNIVLAVWDGVQGAEGITTSDLAAQYGSTFF